MPNDVELDLDSACGYRRDPAVQEAFDQAASRLREVDGWLGPEGERTLVADLALEGGGVKGIGLVGAVMVLAEAGYRFRCVAGTSAGAIAATLIAGDYEVGGAMQDLRRYLGSLDFNRFVLEGRVHRILDHVGGRAGSLAVDAAVLSHKMGLYSGDYLGEWLSPILHDELGVRTFDDLKLTVEDDPGMSVPAGHDYRLLVHTSDITRGQLVHLPWDYPLYGSESDQQDVVTAVRASMSIPFFFEPVTFSAQSAAVSVPGPGGRPITQHYEAGTVTWVDGGMLRNFPIDAFDRANGTPRAGRPSVSSCPRSRRRSRRRRDAGARSLLVCAVCTRCSTSGTPTLSTRPPPLVLSSSTTADSLQPSSG